MYTEEIIKEDELIIGKEYVYRDGFIFQRLTQNGKWYVTYKNHIINTGAYRADLEGWIDYQYYPSES